MRDIPFSLKLYRWLETVPTRFSRELCRAPGSENFATKSAETGGIWALAAVWVRLLTDLAVSVPAQLSREIVQDLKYTLRLWSKRPWHAGFATAALAIGIGANTGVFSVVEALLLRSLPFHEPNRLALLHQFIPPHDSAKQFHDWRQQSAYLADTALFEENDVNLAGVRGVTRAHVARTSGNFFSVLGTKPLLGRGFGPEDEVGRHGRGIAWAQRGSSDRLRALAATLRRRSKGPGRHHPDRWKPAHSHWCRAG